MVASHRRDEPVRRATFRIATALIIASAGVGLALNLADGDGEDVVTSTWKSGLAVPVLPPDPAPVVSLTEIPLSPVPTTPASGESPTSVGAATGQAAARVTRSRPATVMSAPAVPVATSAGLPPAPTTTAPTTEASTTSAPVSPAPSAPAPTTPDPTAPPATEDPAPSTTATPTGSEAATPDPSPSGDLP